jgi:FAD-dependent oxidoreductase domain-containing protein 1
LAGRYDIIVVGAGIMGVASAYHLKKNSPEKEILVVDRYGAPGQGNTGRSNSMFRNTFSSADNQVLSDASIEFYRHVQDELKTDVGLQQIGYLWLMDEAKLSSSEPYLKEMAKNGVETRTYGVDELRRMLPGMVTDFSSNEEASLLDLPPVDGGIFGPKCGRLDPDKLVRFYAGEFTRMGGKFAYNVDVTGLKVAPANRLDIEGEPFVWQDSHVEGVSVRGRTDGPLLADTVVIAAGAWENELLEPVGIDGRVKSKKRQLFSVQARGEKLGKLLHTSGFSPLNLVPLVILPKSGVHFKPVSEENEFWVECEDEFNRPYIDLPEHDLEKYAAEKDYYERSVYPVLTSYFPDFKQTQVRAMWAGLYAYNTLDNLPFAFRERNLIVVGGDSGSGIMKSDSLGRIVDALYRRQPEATLYGGTAYQTSKIGFEHRDVQREEWIL